MPLVPKKTRTVELVQAIASYIPQSGAQQGRLDMPSKDVLLVGKSRSAELDWNKLDAEARAKVQQAKASELQKWCQFNATRDVSHEEYEALKQKGVVSVGTRWFKPKRTMEATRPDL